MAEEHLSHQLAGPFPAGQNNRRETLSPARQKPDDEGKRDQAHRSNLLDDLAEGLMKYAAATPISL